MCHKNKPPTSPKPCRVRNFLHQIEAVLCTASAPRPLLAAAEMMLRATGMTPDELTQKLESPVSRNAVKSVHDALAAILPEAIPPPHGACKSLHFHPEATDCLLCAECRPQAYQWCMSLTQFKNRVWSLVAAYQDRFRGNSCLLDSRYGMGPVAAIRGFDAAEAKRARALVAAQKARAVANST